MKLLVIFKWLSGVIKNKIKDGFWLLYKNKNTYSSRYLHTVTYFTFRTRHKWYGLTFWNSTLSFENCGKSIKEVHRCRQLSIYRYSRNRYLICSKILLPFTDYLSKIFTFSNSGRFLGWYRRVNHISKRTNVRYFVTKDCLLIN